MERSYRAGVIVLAAFSGSAGYLVAAGPPWLAAVAIIATVALLAILIG